MKQNELLLKCEMILHYRLTPGIINELNADEVFVFGTDPDGNHKSSAARLAVKKFGAQIGKGEGLFGQTYAIPIHKHRTWKMAEAVSRFIEIAKNNPDKKFLVLAVGCGAAGMDVTEVALMFEKAVAVENIFLPAVFISPLIDYYENGCSRKYNLCEMVSDCLHSIRVNGYSPKGRIAMTRYYGFVLDDSGNRIFIGNESSKNYNHLKKLKTHVRIVSIAGTFSDEVGLTIDGNIVTSIKSEHSSLGSTDSSFIQLLKFLEKSRFDDFHDIESINAGECHIVGVRQDGIVICWDGQGGWDDAPDLKKEVKEWRNIKQVAVGFENIIALNNNGCILGTDEKFYNQYSDFIQVDAYGHYYGDCYSMALRSNGTVMSPNYEGVSAWRDIVQIACGWDTALGLRKDGCLEVISDNAEVIKRVSSWKHIVNVECKFSQIIAISEEGRIYSMYIH